MKPLSLYMKNDVSILPSYGRHMIMYYRDKEILTPLGPDLYYSLRQLVMM